MDNHRFDIEVTHTFKRSSLEVYLHTTKFGTYWTAIYFS